MRRSTQITNSHCGPAVIQMLLSHLNISITQTAVVGAAKVGRTIKKHGMRISQMAEAAYKLAPNTTFWYKRKATIGDLRKIIHQYHYPVGVEWQGLFHLGDQEKEETIHDQGHYSVVIRVDATKKKLVLVDPYKSFSANNRMLSHSTFYKRWWDTNQVINPKTGKKRILKDRRMLFVITPNTVIFPASLGLKSA